MGIPLFAMAANMASCFQPTSCIPLSMNGHSQEIAMLSSWRPLGSSGICRYHSSKCCVLRTQWSARDTAWRRTAAAFDEVPNEVLEDSKFARINADDPCFGPTALLLMGFSREDVHKVHNLLSEIDGEFMKVVLATSDMMSGTLGRALDTEQDYTNVRPAEGVPRVCFISGLTGEEVMMIIESFTGAGMEKPIFAGHVPNNTMKNLRELVNEILEDHNRLSEERERAKA